MFLWWTPAACDEGASPFVWQSVDSWGPPRCLICWQAGWCPSCLAWRQPNFSFISPLQGKLRISTSIVLTGQSFQDLKQLSPPTWPLLCFLTYIQSWRNQRSEYVTNIFVHPSFLTIWPRHINWWKIKTEKSPRQLSKCLWLLLFEQLNVSLFPLPLSQV